MMVWGRGIQLHSADRRLVPESHALLICLVSR